MNYKCHKTLKYQRVNILFLPPLEKTIFFWYIIKWHEKFQANKIMWKKINVTIF